MKFIGLLLAFAILLPITTFGQQKNKSPWKKLLSNNRNVDVSTRTTHHSKWVATGLNVSLGLFGVHRLYLGTSTKVPVIYTFTLGGGGILMLSDLGVIIFTKDLERFADNPRVLMWSKG